MAKPNADVGSAPVLVQRAKCLAKSASWWLLEAIFTGFPTDLWKKGHDSKPHDECSIRTA
jgi:hypothetical protein